MPEMTEKNTKAQILSAYKGTLEEVKRLKAGQLNPKAEKEKQRKAELKSNTQSSHIQGTLSTLTKVAQDVPETVEEIIETLEAKAKQLAEFDELISIRRGELEELFSISAEAESLAALVESHKRLRAELEEEIAGVRKRWAEEKQEQQKVHAREAEEAEQAHSRRITEWEYAFNRQVQQKKDEFEDQLIKRKKDFQEGLDVMVKQESARQEALDKREKDLSEREEKMQELEELVERLKAETDSRVMEASQAAKDKAKISFNIELNAIKKSHEAEVTVLQGRNEALVEQVANLRDENATLSAKLNDAYAKIQDVALKSLESQGNSRMVELSRSMASEQPRQGKN